MKPGALIIDDDDLSRDYLAEALTKFGYCSTAVGTVGEARREIAEGEFDVVVSDLRLPDGDGLDVVSATRARLPETPVVVLTAFGTVECAVEAMKRGASDFLLKPVAFERIQLLIRRLERERELRRENKVLRATVEDAAPNRFGLIGQSPRLLEAVGLARRVARTRATVLIRGESGTGKELIAALLHRESPRSAEAFIRVNCAALTESLLTTELFGHEKGAFTGAEGRREGRFELAAKGTLFLDEIGELPLEVQAKLLRVLETGDFERVGGTRTLKTDVRVVAATNRDLEASMKAGRFREDLFFRLNVVPVDLPPLRDRIEDIPALARHFLERFRREYASNIEDIGPEAMEALAAAPWPGNVRELSNVLQRAVLSCRGERIEVADLGLPGGSAVQIEELPVGMSLEEMERRLILKTLDATQWARNRSAEILGVTTRTLSNKLKLWRQMGIISEETTRRRRRTTTQVKVEEGIA